MKQQKGQAAMEFLMTYGWAILVVLTIIGALAYFGVLTPDLLLPEKCTLKVGLTCTDHKTTGNIIMMKLRNGEGRDIKITNITALSESLTAKCSTPFQTTLKNNEEAQFDVIGCLPSTSKQFIKDKYRMDITYNYVDGGASHTAQGEVLAKKEDDISSSSVNDNFESGVIDESVWETVVGTSIVEDPSNPSNKVVSSGTFRRKTYDTITSGKSVSVEFESQYSDLWSFVLKISNSNSSDQMFFYVTFGNLYLYTKDGTRTTIIKSIPWEQNERYVATFRIDDTNGNYAKLYKKDDPGNILIEHLNTTMAKGLAYTPSFQAIGQTQYHDNYHET